MRSFPAENRKSLLRKNTALPPNVRKMVHWILSGKGRGPNGEVAGWVQNDVASFWYPESGGYALSFFSYLYHLSQDPVYLNAAHRVARWLGKIHSRGAYGRDNRLYLFDSSMVLKGFAHYLIAHPPALKHFSALVKSTRHFLVHGLRENIPCTPLPPKERGHETRWSQKEGPHLIKAAAALDLYGRTFHDEEARDAARTFVSDLLCRWSEGWVWNPTGAALYLHPQCYALEGFFMLRSDAPLGVGGWIQNGLFMLAQLQDDSGGMPSHCFSRPFKTERAFPCRSDITSQAMRLWLLDGAGKWRAPFEKAKTFLLRNSHPSGAILYEPGLSDQNMWATLFTAQALLWKEHAPDVAWIV